ncbi:MAG: hypothetical protein JWN26_833 [Candidatus Saccharibacteria bacterium]|nr:hypothetical protein [Candidatus Saccharibacteria bacterium]
MKINERVLIDSGGSKEELILQLLLIGKKESSRSFFPLHVTQPNFAGKAPHDFDILAEIRSVSCEDDEGNLWRIGGKDSILSDRGIRWIPVIFSGATSSEFYAHYNSLTQNGWLMYGDYR